MRVSALKWIGAALAVGAAFVLLSNLELPPQCTRLGGSGAIAIEIGRIARGQAKLFCYGGDAGEKIRFILARGNDGVVHTVFDACRQCYSYRKGYRLTRNGSLICRLCGNRYTVDHMMAGKASCAPVALPHQQTGSTIRISAADMRSGRGLF
jgi:uncharacterized membrane protein